jgi:hypothetical protein
MLLSLLSLVMRSCPEYLKVLQAEIFRNFQERYCGCVGEYWYLRFVIIALKDEQRDVRLFPSATAEFARGCTAATAAPPPAGGE